MAPSSSSSSATAHISSMNARAERALRNNPFTSTELTKSPNWQRFVAANLLTRQDQDVLTLYEKQPGESVQELLDTENNGDTYARAMFKALDQITEPKVAEYVLELLTDFLVSDFSNRLVYFETNAMLPDLSGLLRHMESDNTIVRDKSCALVGLFLSLPNKTLNAAESMNSYMTWCVEQMRANHLSNPNHSTVRSAFFGLSIALQNETCRDSFVKHGGMRFLSFYLNLAATNNVLTTQEVYEVCFTAWLLSLTRANEFGFAECSDLVQLLSDGRKEKINRLVLAILRNLTQVPNVGEWFVQFGLARVLQRTSRITDVEMLGDLEELQTFLSNAHSVVSAFTMYSQECASGKLKANNLTHSERFWKENVKEFEHDDFATLKQLLGLVQDMADNVTLQVALSDLGYFCQFYPNGRTILTLFGAKNCVMSLLEHPDKMVQRAALVCISKMLVTQWEFLSIGSS